MKKVLLLIASVALGGAAMAKLPAPSDEAKAKAAEAAAKTAHANKVADYQLCKSREKTAAHYYKTTGKGKPVSKEATPACADPGPYKPPEQVAAPAAAPASAAKPAAKG
ncbi:MAG: hypothetical protein ACKOWC_12985 [Limnohabitans sp.]